MSPHIVQVDTPRDAMPAITQQTRVKSNLVTIGAVMAAVFFAGGWCMMIQQRTEALTSNFIEFRAEMKGFMVEMREALRERHQP